MEIDTKIMKSGNAWYFRIPKALIDCKVLDKEKEYKLEVKSKDNKGLIVYRPLDNINSILSPVSSLI